MRFFLVLASVIALFLIVTPASRAETPEVLSENFVQSRAVTVLDQGQSGFYLGFSLFNDRILVKMGEDSKFGYSYTLHCSEDQAFLEVQSFFTKNPLGKVDTFFFKDKSVCQTNAMTAINVLNQGGALMVDLNWTKGTIDKWETQFSEAQKKLFLIIAIAEENHAQNSFISYEGHSLMLLCGDAPKVLMNDTIGKGNSKMFVFESRKKCSDLKKDLNEMIEEGWGSFVEIDLETKTVSPYSLLVP